MGTSGPVITNFEVIKKEEKEENTKKEPEEEEEDEEEEEEEEDEEEEEKKEENKFYEEIKKKNKKEKININELLKQLENELIKVNKKINYYNKQKYILESKIKKIKDQNKKNKVQKQMHNDNNDKVKNEQIIIKKMLKRKKYIDTSKALKMESTDQDLFILGLISQNLEDRGILSAIEKKGNFEEQINDFSWFQYLINDNKKKFVLDFKFDKQKARNY